MQKFRHIDIHSHLNFPQFGADREQIIAQMREEGIATITVGTDLKTSHEAVALAEKHPHLFATIGIHPSDAEEGFDEKKFESLLDVGIYPERSRRIVAVGECGLDYYRSPQMNANDTQIYADRQKELFVKQIRFAQKHQLPLMIHCRASAGTMDAYEGALDILETYNKQQTTNNELRGNFHFFAGNLDIAKGAVTAGFTLSFDGPVTFTTDYDEVIRFVPEDMLMAETDAPFAAPAPHRGKRNSPLFLPHIVKRLAQVRGTDEERFKNTLLQNARRVFPKLHLPES